jgi:hypothetical protein
MLSLPWVQLREGSRGKSNDIQSSCLDPLSWPFPSFENMVYTHISSEAKASRVKRKVLFRFVRYHVRQGTKGRERTFVKIFIFVMHSPISTTSTGYVAVLNKKTSTCSRLRIQSTIYHRRYASRSACRSFPSHATLP